MYEDVSTVGITDLDNYPICKCKRYFKQCMQSDTLRIPPQKPCVESVNEVNISICVDETKIIKTILGPKLIIHGTKKLKVIYTASNEQQSVHSAHWIIPFCEFILINTECFNKCGSNIKDVFIGVENVSIRCIEPKLLEICVLYIICPKINSNTLC